MSPHHRNRVKGIIINKFYGDKELFQEGVSFIESYTGIPVLGVIPFMDNHQIEEEDSFITQHQSIAKKSGGDKYDEWAFHVASNIDWTKLKNMVELP